MFTTLSQVEAEHLRLLALYTDWHSMSRVAARASVLRKLARRGLLETRITPGPVEPKVEARLTERGREVAATLAPVEDGRH